MHESAQIFHRFLDKGFNGTTQQGNALKKTHVGVVVCPWVDTCVPWYSITIAILLKRKGFQPYFIWDDLNFEREVAATRRQNSAIAGVLDRISSEGWDIIRLSQVHPGPTHEQDRLIVEDAALLNAQWIQTSAVPTKELEKVRLQCQTNLLANAKQIAGLLQAKSSDLLLVPGGVYRNSGLLLRMAQVRGVNVSTYDSGSISMAVGYNSVAARFADLPSTLSDALQTTADIRRRIRASAKEEFFKRLMGRDKYIYQHQKIGKRRGGILQNRVFIPLNIETDATALGLSRYFSTSWDWLNQTIKFLLNETTSTVVVRQHPYEAKKPGDRMVLPRILKHLFPDSRLMVHTCYDKVNSYELLSSASLVLPYVSTMGIEAAMLGKEVIIESNVFYAGMPFAPQASSKEDYFSRITTSLADESFVSSTEMLETAWIVYFLTTICGRIWTEFTPQPQNFNKWAKGSLDTLWQMPVVHDLLDALSGTKSVTGIQFENFVQSCAVKHLKPQKLRA